MKRTYFCFVCMNIDNNLKVIAIFFGFSINHRSYSTSAKASKNADKEPTEIVTAITSTECKHVNNDENLLPWFLNRTHTCDSLRLRDAGQKVNRIFSVFSQLYRISSALSILNLFVAFRLHWLVGQIGKNQDFYTYVMDTEAHKFSSKMMS